MYLLRACIFVRVFIINQLYCTVVSLFARNEMTNSRVGCIITIIRRYQKLEFGRFTHYSYRRIRLSEKRKPQSIYSMHLYYPCLCDVRVSDGYNC